MKKAIGRPSKYPYEFRKMIAQKVLSGLYTYRALEREFLIPIALIGRRKKLYQDGKLDEMNEPRVKSDKLELKMMNLEKENRLLKEQLGELYSQVQHFKNAQNWS